MRTLVLGAAIGALALAASARSAAADCYDAECRERVWAKPRFEGAFGLLAGGYAVADVSGAAIGMHADAGVRLDKWALVGEYDFVSIGEDPYEVADPIRGQLHRLGANARYSLIAIGGREVPLRGDFWLEGGVGNQLVQWNGGGELSRRDLAFGVGGQLTVRLGDDKPSFLGFYYAFRGLAARDPFEHKGPATCAGPCDMATGPSPYDLAAFFNFGIVLSR